MTFREPLPYNTPYMTLAVRERIKAQALEMSDTAVDYMENHERLCYEWCKKQLHLRKYLEAKDEARRLLNA